MSQKFLFIINLFFLFSCSNKNHEKFVRIKDSKGIVLKGKVFADSLFDGKVKYYDILNNYLGYSTYKYGKKEGVEVSYFKNGKISDSSFYHNNMRNGFGFKYNENGKLSYKSYYLNDRPFGHLYEYDTMGNVTHYYFINFERKIIFETFKEDSIEYCKGEQIQANVFSESTSNNQIDHLFLYLFSSPFSKRHYEVAILDSNNKILLSKKIISSGCYYEQPIPDLPNGNKYAIILRTYNPYKKRDDLGIKIIE